MTTETNYCIDLEHVGLAVPTINVKAPYNKKKINTSITSNPPIIQNIKIGEQTVAVGTYNISNNSVLIDNNKDQKKHMEATAKYIYDQFKAGVTLLSLQGIPNPDTDNFDILEKNLTELAKKDKPPVINVDNLNNYFSKTKRQKQDNSFDYPSGTTILCNPTVFKIKNKVEDILNEHGQLFNVQPIAQQGNSFDVAVIHGNSKDSDATIDYIKKFEKGLILGDSNLFVSSGQSINDIAEKLKTGTKNSFDSIVASELTIKKEKVQTNIVNVVIDRISPATYVPNKTAIANPNAPVTHLKNPPLTVTPSTYEPTNSIPKSRTLPSSTGTGTTTISSRSNSTNFTRSNPLQDIYIYAPPAKQTSSEKSLYARAPYKLTPEEKNTWLTAENGLSVCAPGGMPYQFSYANGTPTAKIGPQAANVDQKTLAITIISMIDNVLAKGDRVSVDTDDPKIAEIAKNYFNHLEKEKNITTKDFIIKYNGQIYTPTSSTMNTKLRALMTQIDNEESPRATHSWTNEIKNFSMNIAHQFRANLNLHRHQGQLQESGNDNNKTYNNNPKK